MARGKHLTGTKLKRHRQPFAAPPAILQPHGLLEGLRAYPQIILWCPHPNSVSQSFLSSIRLRRIATPAVLLNRHGQNQLKMRHESLKSLIADSL